ncbi:MAG: hypothetical protein AAF086_03720 [Planctomycetota bacterium]
MKILLLSMLIVAAASSLAEESVPADKQEVNVLFIGNSFTHRHDIPSLVKTIFQEGHPGLTVNTRKMIYGGQNMFTHWTYFKSQTFLEMNSISEDTIRQRMDQIQELQSLSELPSEYVAYPKTLGKKGNLPKLATFQNALGWAFKQHEHLLKQNPRTKWDYVVLQSWVDEHVDLEKGYAGWAMNFVEVAEQHDTKVILYITAPFVQNPEPVDQPRQEGQVALQMKVAQKLADQIDAYAVVPVPLAINMIQQGGTDLTFCYEKDFHPNQTTAFLTANLFYAAFFKQSPEGFAFDTVTETKLDDDGKDPDGGDATVVFDESTKTYLQRIAYEAVEAFNQTTRSGQSSEPQ